MKKFFNVSKFLDKKVSEEKPIEEPAKEEKKRYGFFVRFDDDKYESIVMVSADKTLRLNFSAEEPYSMLELVTTDGRRCVLSYKEFNIEDLKNIDNPIPPFDGIPPLSE